MVDSDYSKSYEYEVTYIKSDSEFCNIPVIAWDDM